MPTKDRRLTTGRRERPKRFISRERVGGSDPTNFLGAPAHFGVFSTVTFAFTASLSPTLQRNCARHRVKNLEKTKLKKVILTLFTCSVWILAARHGATRVIYVFHAPFTFPTLVRGLENGKAQKQFLPWHRFEFEGLAQHRFQKHLFVGSDIRESDARRIRYLRTTGRKGFWATRRRRPQMASNS